MRGPSLPLRRCSALEAWRLLGRSGPERPRLTPWPRAWCRCWDPSSAAADGAGRPLFSANRDVEVTGSVEGLWQALTTLREHRGDGHVAVLTEAGLDGCEVHLVAVAASGQDPATYQAARGWSHEEWAEAADRLRARGLLDAEAHLTPEGRVLHEGIERRTDELAIMPYRCLSEAAFSDLLSTLGELARGIAAAGAISYPNPMGLPELDRRELRGGLGRLLRSPAVLPSCRVTWALMPRAHRGGPGSP